MSHPGALPIVEAVKKIFDLYNNYNPDPAQFRITTTSKLLKTVTVFEALLDHAIAPNSVAKDFWEFLKPFFNDILQEHGDPTDLQSLVLGPRSGQWTMVENKLLLLSETTLGSLTQAMNDHARDWMAWVVLPIRSRGRTPASLQSTNTLHKRIAKFREQVMEREGNICPVTLLRDKVDIDKVGEESGPLVPLEAAHIVPFSTANTRDTFWKYIEMFTGDLKIQNILHDINVIENGILLEHNVHAAFGDLEWGIETKSENGNCRYFIKTFRRFIDFRRPGAGTGTELHFSNRSGHNPPNPDVCEVAHACGAAEVFNKLFEHDPDIIGPVSGQYTLPTDPMLDDFAIPYFERRLYEERIHVPPLQLC